MSKERERITESVEILTNLFNIVNPLPVDVGDLPNHVKSSVLLLV